eukprot:6649879-Lingulodinium_polyedra.AAC.1
MPGQVVPGSRPGVMICVCHSKRPPSRQAIVLSSMIHSCTSSWLSREASTLYSGAPLPTPRATT